MRYDHAGAKDSREGVEQPAGHDLGRGWEGIVGCRWCRSRESSSTCGLAGQRAFLVGKCWSFLRNITIAVARRPPCGAVGVDHGQQYVGDGKLLSSRAHTRIYQGKFMR